MEDRAAAHLVSQPNLPATGRGNHRTRTALPLVVGLFLAFLAFAAFAGALGGVFLEYDDKQYVVDNPVVCAGLTWGGVRLALTRSYAANWHPLTWISLMLDTELFGLDPRGFHLTNVLLHAANAVLLFFLVRALTGSIGRSAVVAALFAVHPLRVESVAWIAERKDVLSASFGLLALLAYGRYARRPGVRLYLLTTLLFALGLAAKPMLVTWPLLMLILDVWPLGRVRPSGTFDPRSAGEVPAGGWRTAVVGRLLVEKIPWVIMAAATALLTFTAQSRGGAVVDLGDYAWGSRFVNVLWAFGAYLGKTVWPRNLTAFYPFEERSLFSPVVLGAALLLLVITFVAGANARRRPWVAAGWCWYLVSLVPVIGVVRVGSHAMADRYTYIPLIGPVLALTWTVAGWARGSRRRRGAAVAGAAVLILVLAGMTRSQTAYWRDDEALFTHMLAVVPGNPVGYFGLGRMHHQRGRWEDAERFYRKSIESNPRYYQVRIQQARLYRDTGRNDEAEAAYREALKINPDDALAQSVFGLLLQRSGKIEEAVEHLEAVVRLQPELAEAHNNLGVVLAQLGRLREAVGHFRRALEIHPRYEEARANLAAVLSGGDAAGEH